MVFNTLISVLYENTVQQKNFTLRICKEVMQAHLFVFYFTKNFYLVSEFNELLSSLESAGLIEYRVSKYVPPNSMQRIEQQPPTALNYSNTEGFFALFYYGCVLALVSFICEIIFGYMCTGCEW